jgi:hypothetical protein
MAAAPQPLCLCLHFHMALSLDVHLFSPSHKDSGYIGVKAHYTLVWPNLNWLHLQRPNFQSPIRRPNFPVPASVGTRSWNLDTFLWQKGHNSTPILGNPRSQQGHADLGEVTGQVEKAWATNVFICRDRAAFSQNSLSCCHWKLVLIWNFQRTQWSNLKEPTSRVATCAVIMLTLFY